MVIVTISRLLGSHGEEIGRMVADEMAIPYIDQEIIDEAALRAGVSLEALKDVDERRPSLLTRMANIILGQALDEEMGYPITPIPSTPVLTPEVLRSLIEEVIVEVASRGSAVIIGRGAHHLLKNRESLLRVRTYAAFETRVERIAEQRRIDKKTAEKLVRDNDGQRAGYMQTYFHSDWREPSQYDIMINTGSITDELAVSMIVTAANMVAARS